MPWCNFSLSILVMTTLLDSSYPSLHSVFRHFEIVHREQMKVRSRRDTQTGRVNKYVTFSALRKTFHMLLSPGSPVLHPEFRVIKIDRHGAKTDFQMKLDEFYTGFLLDAPHVEIDAAHLEGVWLAQIYHTDALYTVEPLSHHDPLASGTDMLVYKAEDVKWDNMTGSAGEPGNKMFPFCHEVDLTPRLETSKTRAQRAGNEGHTNDAIDPHVMSNKHGKTPGNERHSMNSTDPQISEEHVETQSQWASQNIDNEKPLMNKLFQRSPTVENVQKRSSDKGSEQESGHVPTYSTCEILAIADYEAYRKIGKRSVMRVTSLLVHVHQTANRIFRRTQFRNMTGVGTLLKCVIIHTDYTKTKVNHYNMANNTLDVEGTVRSLEYVKQGRRYCIVHLTTQRNFGIVLGLATRASVRSTRHMNGICGHSEKSTLNFGLSTLSTAHDRLLPLPNYILVLTHELGHNFGSPHDPVLNSDCSPSASDGGKYIMWPSSGMRLGRNSKVFSPCSRESIGLVLEDRAPLCFLPSSAAAPVCGNGLVEPGEDCDPGGFDTEEPGTCCEKNCRFIEGAVCSPINHPCCTDGCTVAPSTQQCLRYHPQPCYETPLCSGKHHDDCLEPLALPNNSTCDDGGKCSYGECLPFCQVLGLSMDPPRQMLPCSCEEDSKSMCRHCCMDVMEDRHCKIMGGVRDDGQPCLYGQCLKGNCEKAPIDDNSMYGFEADYMTASCASCLTMLFHWLRLMLLSYTLLNI